MSYYNLINNFLALLCIIVLLSTFPFIFGGIAKVSGVIAIIGIFDALKSVQRKYLLNKTVSPGKKAIFITGCDSGFGHLLAHRMDQLGYHVFAGCLYPDGEGAQRLKNKTSTKLQILQTDVTNHHSVLNSLNFVKKNMQEDEEFWALVNNAGISQSGEIEWTPIEEFLRVYDVNTLGMLRITKTFLPLLRQFKGRIVNTTSFAGRLTSPGYVGYCMSKTAAVSFTDGLRIEMAKWGVKAISIEPFFYRTGITETEQTLKSIENNFEESSKDIQEAYGKEYLNAFMDSCRRLLQRCSPHLEEVIHCFEDAITSEEPDQDYFPCYLPHKVVLKLWMLLPHSMVDKMQEMNMPRSVKPKALSY